MLCAIKLEVWCENVFGQGFSERAALKCISSVTFHWTADP